MPKKDTEPVGFKYAVTFPPRPQGATSSTAAPSQDDLPSHVYDVNAAYEEAYQRARASMHPGGDSDNHSDGEGTDGDDDVRALGYVSAANRQSMRAALMQKQKSKSRRASKLFVEDDQVVSFLSDGFQAIKVRYIHFRVVDF